MKKKSLVDKTFVFKGLQDELRAAGYASGGLHAQLEAAESDLCSYFENRQLLRKALSVGALTYEHAFLQANANRPHLVEFIKRVIAELRASRDANPKSFLTFWAHQVGTSKRAIDNSGQVAILQFGKEDLDIELLVKSYFRDIGDLIEGSLQILMRIRLEAWQIAGRRATSAPPVASLTLGKLTEELLSRPGETAIYQPPPAGISVSQWRNIANHNSYEVSGDSIVCTFGQPGRQKSLTLSLEELTDSLSACNASYYAHKVAIELFTIDNLESLNSASPTTELTDYSKETSLVYGLVCEGFSIVAAKRLPGKWIISLRDDHNRTEAELRTSLQVACYSYVLFVNPVEFKFLIESSHRHLTVGFASSLLRKGDPLPSGFRGDVWEVEPSFRLGRQESKR